MANEFGIKETKELVTAAGDVSVLLFKAQKQGRDAEGKLDAGKVTQALIGLLMSNPKVIDDLKVAFDGIQGVPSEIKDISIAEILDLGIHCGTVAKNCAEAIKE